jgi:glycosyltransferase involved in cell wall biosynthesis
MQFTVAIPAYKSKFLAECIQSILVQNCTDFELIIINDCSPESIDEIVGQFSDPRISYYKNEVNIGAEHLVKNWNGALEKASGEFFVMMGDDDRMEANYLEEFARLISKYKNLNVFHCRSLMIDENSAPIKLTPSWPEYETVYDSIWHRLSGFRLQFISDFVYRTSALKNNGGFFDIPLAWASDDITAYIASKDLGIAHTNLPIFNYRQTRYTISSSGSAELKMKAILMEKNWYDAFLTVVPSNENDRITRDNLCKMTGPFIQSKKLRTIADSLAVNFFSNLIKWYEIRSKYNISLLDIVKSAFKSLKKRWLG